MLGAGSVRLTDRAGRARHTRARRSASAESLPLLAAARIGFRDILGYAAVVFVVYNVVVSVTFWLWPRLA